MTSETDSGTLRLSDFDYDLPESLIAQTPVEPRDHSRLMSLSRADGSIRHHRFYDLPQLLRPGDLMVFNDSRVMPARLRGNRILPSRLHDTRELPSRFDTRNSVGAIELLLLSRLSPGIWRAIGRPGRLLRPGSAFEVSGEGGSMHGEVLEIEPDGERIIRLDGEERLHDVGEVPLPPYITETLADSERYQTVYAREEGSAAAPTAGLHFTDGLLQQVRDMGVQTVFVTLHVGWGTFRPVKDDDVTDHIMHAEYWELTQQAAGAIRCARSEGRRIISVGTTAVRLLENAASLSDDGLPECGFRLGGHIHHARLPLQGRGRAHHQLPPAPLDAPDAHQRLLEPRNHAERLRRSRRAAVSLLQLRRCHVHH